MSKEAMKLALEALEAMQSYAAAERKGLRICDEAITALRQALAKPDFWEGYVPEPVKPAQQEPVDILIEAWQYLDETHGHLLDTGDVEGRMHISVIRSAWKQMDSLVQQIWDERGQPNEQEPFGFAVMENPIAPPAQRTWVGLTDEEKSDIWCVVTNRDFVTEDTHVYADAIEAKLRSKNEDRN